MPPPTACIVLSLIFQLTVSCAPDRHCFWPCADAAAKFAWSGAVGLTAVGLLLIGVMPVRPCFHMANRYGVNDNTYSFMASRISAAMIEGDRREWHSDFAIDRWDITRPAR